MIIISFIQPFIPPSMSREFPADNIEKGRWGGGVRNGLYLLYIALERLFFRRNGYVSVILKMLVEISFKFFSIYLFFLAI